MAAVKVYVDRGVQTETVPAETVHIARGVTSTLGSRKEGRNPGKPRVLSLPTQTASSTDHDCTPRVVSLSERPKPSSFSPSAAPFTPNLNPDSFDCSRSFTTVSAAISSSSEIPHTPSPPSSPESVMICLTNDTRLSHDFMRRGEQGGKKSTQSVSDSAAHNFEPAYKPEIRRQDGWLTWTSSPPRPIPALHGPSSLPYARCPSGAEGTIIEPTDNVSRLVWGMRAGEAASTSADAREHPRDFSPVPHFAQRTRIDLPPPSPQFYNRPMPPSINREVRMASDTTVPDIGREIGRVTQAALQTMRDRGTPTTNGVTSSADGYRPVYHERRALEEEKRRLLEAKRQFEEERRDALLLDQRRYERMLDHRSLQQHVLDQDRVERRLEERTLEEHSLEQQRLDAEALERVLRARGAKVTGTWSRDASKMPHAVSNRGPSLEEVMRSERSERGDQWRPVYEYHDQRAFTDGGEHVSPRRGPFARSQQAPQSSHHQFSPINSPNTIQSQLSSTPPSIHARLQQQTNYHHSTLPTPPSSARAREEWFLYYPGRDEFLTPELSPPVFAIPEERPDIRRIGDPSHDQLRQYAQDRSHEPTTSLNTLGAPAQIRPRSNFSEQPQSVSIPIRSPIGPPPNLPLPPVTSSTKLRNTPPSVSPSAPHAPRSVPFARMLQRTLASVPEEEGNLSATAAAPQHHSSRPAVKLATASSTSLLPPRPVMARAPNPLSTLATRSQLSEKPAMKETDVVSLPKENRKENEAEGMDDKENKENVKAPRRRHRGGKKARAAAVLASGVAEQPS